MYTKNNNGPNTVPWGKPEATDTGEDRIPLIVTLWVQLLKKTKSNGEYSLRYHTSVTYKIDVCGGLCRKLCQSP